MFVSKLVRKFLPPCRRRVVVAAAAWSNEFKDGAAETAVPAAARQVETRFRLQY